MKKVRVLVVEDSALVRRMLVDIIQADPRLEVVADVGSAEAALQRLEELRPDVITMDLRLPGLSGIEAIRQIMSTTPTPIVVVAGASRSDEVDLTDEALKAGVVQVLAKPQGLSRESFGRMARLICNQLVIMSQVRVIRQRPLKPLPQFSSTYVPGREGFQIMGLVASTGGPAAVARLLEGLGPGFALPILLVQHISSSFIESFRNWLDGVSPLSVCIAKEGERPQPGHVYLAPPDKHITLGSAGIHLDSAPADQGHRPSGNVLLTSLALQLKTAGMGVLLTGMGEDGALGMLEMRRAGGFTIAEHESTAVVHGMPGAAQRMGAAVEVRPLHQIAPRILQLIRP